jgi:hypothetical protein
MTHTVRYPVPKKSPLIELDVTSYPDAAMDYRLERSDAYRNDARNLRKSLSAALSRAIIDHQEVRTCAIEYMEKWRTIEYCISKNGCTSNTPQCARYAWVFSRAPASSGGREKITLHGDEPWQETLCLCMVAAIACIQSGVSMGRERNTDHRARYAVFSTAVSMTTIAMQCLGANAVRIAMRDAIGTGHDDDIDENDAFASSLRTFILCEEAFRHLAELARAYEIECKISVFAQSKKLDINHRRAESKLTCQMATHWMNAARSIPPIYDDQMGACTEMVARASQHHAIGFVNWWSCEYDERKENPTDDNGVGCADAVGAMGAVLNAYVLSKHGYVCPTGKVAEWTTSIRMGLEDELVRIFHRNPTPVKDAQVWAFPQLKDVAVEQAMPQQQPPPDAVWLLV